MKFKTLYGAERRVKNPHRFLIKWDAPSKSKFQTMVKDFLYPSWYNLVVFEEFPIPSTKMSLDLFNATDMIAVEVQGNQHVKWTPFFQKNRTEFLKQLKRDSLKQQFCDDNNIKLVCIYPDDNILENFKEEGIQL